MHENGTHPSHFCHREISSQAQYVGLKDYVGCRNFRCSYIVLLRGLKKKTSSFQNPVNFLGECCLEADDFSQPEAPVHIEETPGDLATNLKSRRALRRDA